ncbi:MAG: PQQ-binding-like beta-propeller repeat protein [Gemmataceae bacterium]
MTRPISLACLALLLVAANWPGWRGPGGTGISPEQSLPVKWSDTENVRWKVKLEGAGVGTPVVWGDRVFLTASDGRLDDQLHIYCFSADEGKQLWHTRLFGSGRPEWYFPAGGMAIPTPVSDGKLLYALFGSGDLVCVDLDGQPVWVRSLAEEYGVFRNRWGMAASPLLVDDALIVQVDESGKSYLLAVAAKTGKTIWKTARDTGVNWTSPAVAEVKGKKQILCSGTYRVEGYDLATGKELWRVDGLRQQCVPTPVVAGDLAYVASGPKGTTFAIRLDGATGNLTDSHIVWKSVRGTPGIPTPIRYGAYLFQIDDAGFGTCLDGGTGKEIWRERIGGRYQASVIAGAGKLYYTSLDGVVTVARANPKFEVLAKNRMGESIVATPAIADGRIYIRGKDHLYCIEEKAGR